MDIIYKLPESFRREGITQILPTERNHLLEIGENNANITIIKDTPIIHVLGTPSLYNTIKRIIYCLKDKFTFAKNYNEININLTKYLEKIYFNNEYKNYYKGKKAWYRFIGDLFNDIENKNFKKVMNKLVILLKIIKPILVIDVHNTTKWNYINAFKKFVNILSNNTPVVIRCPLESLEHAQSLFENPKINNIAIIKYIGLKTGHIMSDNVAKYLMEISNGNYNVIRIVLRHCKKELRTVRDIKIPWLKILPKVVPKKYKTLMEAVVSLKKFKIKDLDNIGLKDSTLYNYLTDLYIIGILKKRRHGRNIIYSLNIKNNVLINFLNKLCIYKSIYDVIYNFGSINKKSLDNFIFNNNHFDSINS